MSGTLPCRADKDLATFGDVADMSPTCRRHVELSAPVSFESTRFIILPMFSASEFTSVSELQNGHFSLFPVCPRQGLRLGPTVIDTR